ncbi:MAG: hypothetical protein JWQ43_3709 [Glaciihabitans sp.]|nr:hypothetical protein [Glaciihabitans sp.]
MRWGQGFFAVQAIAGAAWWIAVFASPFLREATLGQLNPVAVAALDIPLFVIASAVAALGVRAAAIVATGWTALVAIALAVYATVTGEAGWGVLVMIGAAGCSMLAASLIVLGRVPTAWITYGPFGFRSAPIRQKTGSYLAQTLGQLVFFWGLFLVVFPLAITSFEHRWGVAIAFPLIAGPVGFVILVLASALGISSAYVMSTLGGGTPLPSAMPNRLVIRGPYRWIRNPMAVAGIAQGVGVGLVLSSWLVVLYAVIGSVLWNYAVRPLEEADLEKRFGDQFRDYCASVRCWVPRFGGIRRLDS